MATAFKSWEIELDGPLLTDWVQGFSISAVVNIGRPSSITAQITLNNNDGDFTPAEGGGTGTFKDVNWFNIWVTIRAVMGSHTPSTYSKVDVFQGVISDFNMVDDGTNSFVTLTVSDWLTVCSSTTFDITESTTTTTIKAGMQSTLNGSAGFGDGVDFPRIYGYGNGQAVLFYGDNTSVVARPAATNTTVLDYLTTAYLSAGPAMLIPRGFEVIAGFPTVVAFYGDVIDRTWMQTDSAYNTPVLFSENPSGSTLPFTRVKPGFNFDLLTSVTAIQSGMSGTTQQVSSNTTTSNSYGTRARYYDGTANKTDADALTAAQVWTSRQSEARYTPRQIDLTIEQIESLNGSSAETALKTLLTGMSMWRPLSITYTPTGGSQVTSECVVERTRINAIPGRTTIILDLLPAQDYQSFVLDSSMLGVLDQNRLG
jgi:hypothetical protein